MRGALLMNKDIFVKLEQIEKKLQRQDKKINKNEDEVKVVIETLKKLVGAANQPRPVIGFRRQNEQNV
jgi:hypothetical protein